MGTPGQPGTQLFHDIRAATARVSISASDGDDAPTGSEGVSGDECDGGEAVPSVIQGPVHERRLLCCRSSAALASCGRRLLMRSESLEAICTRRRPRRVHFSTLSSIITQYEEMEDGKERANGTVCCFARAARLSARAQRRDDQCWCHLS